MGSRAGGLLLSCVQAAFKLVRQGPPGKEEAPSGVGCPTRGHSQTRCLHESGGDREGRKIISSTAAGLPDLQPVEHCTDPALFNVAMEPL